MKKAVLKQTSWCLIIAIVIGALVTIAMRTGLLRSMELRTLDVRFQYRGPKDVKHSELFIVAIDAQTFVDCRERYPYPRNYYATLVENLNEVGVKLIMFDIQFTEPDYNHPETDKILADAVAKAGNVILAGKVERNFTTGGYYEYKDQPLPVLLATGCDWGVVGELQDPDGFTRRYPIFERYQGEFIYSLGAKVFFRERGLPNNPVMKYADHGNFLFSDSSGQNVQRIQGHRGSMGFEQTILVNYYGPAETMPTYSLSSLLDDADFDLVDSVDTDYLELFKKNSVYPLELKLAFMSDSVKQAEGYAALEQGDTLRVQEILDTENPFSGKIALVGVSAEELHDNKFTPFYSYGGLLRMMPGVETHAHAIQTMLDGAYFRVVPQSVDILLIFLFSIITAIIAFFTRPIIGGVVSIALIFGAVVLAFWLFVQHSIWIYLVPMIIVIIASYLGNLVYLFLFEQREKRKIRGMFQTYMSPKVLRYLEDHPDAFRLTGEKREATMFFSDVESFTSISETLSAEELSIVLNKYLSPMTDILMSYDGYVDKYEGDAIMCDFGVPMEDPDHAWKACFSAIDQQNRLISLREQIFKEHGVTIRVRIGINSGIVSAGNMGSEQRFQYTVMGDAVNQASRFEGANKQFGTYTMIGEETYQQAGDSLEVRILDKLVVKGKLIPIKVYELLSKKDELDENRARIRDLYSGGIEYYWERKWDQAIRQFEKALAVTGSDPPSRIFIERCNIYKATPPDANWQGEYVMRTK